MSDNNYSTRAQYIRAGNEMNKKVEAKQFVEANQKKIDFDKKLEELSIKTNIVLSGSVIRKKIINEVGTSDKEIQTPYVNDTAIIENAKEKDEDVIQKKEKHKKEEVDENLLTTQNKGKAIAEKIRNDEGKAVVPSTLRRKVS